MGNTGLTANLGSTNKFFMPWLIPRNDRNSVFRPNFFGKLAGRTKRDEYNDLNTIEKDLDIFQLRLEFCEDKMNNCIEAIQKREQSKGYEGRFSHSTFAPCQIILQDCVKAQIGN